MARLNTPADDVPYAFEKRVTAHLSAASRIDPLGFWAQSLWRAVAPCAAIAILLTAWTLLNPEQSGGSEEFAQHFENTVLAGFDSESIAD